MRRRTLKRRKFRSRVLPGALAWLLLLFAWLVVNPGESSAADGASLERAVAAIEDFSKREAIEGSYFDMALAASRLIDPTLDEKELRAQIDEMAKTASREWEAATTSDAKMKALNRVVFQKYGFARADSPAPIVSGKGVYETYSLPGVLKGKRGHCEGLSTIYLLVAEQANLPVSIVNLPIHSLCRLDLGNKPIYVECLRSGAPRSTAEIHEMNGARPAALKSNVYLSPLTKKQFLCLHLNALAYGLIKQDGGPKPLDMSQMLRLAESIKRLDPNHPESLETAALIHFKAGKPNRAREIIAHAIERAETYGTPRWVMAHYHKMQRQYQNE